jgi:glycine betaine/choline ABC-type transport system substrate-binding protein
VAFGKVWLHWPCDTAVREARQVRRETRADLTAIEDGLRYFPPYDAAPVVRAAALLGHPEIGRAMARLAGRVTERDMRAMNRAVDVDRSDPRDVAAGFLAGLR